jgi:ATP-dependent helicase/DNAse subunit B
LYLDSERRELRSAGVFLETQSERSADEGIFYELISLARESLTLSRPYVQNGVYWPESHLWRAVRLLFDDADRLIEQNRIPLGSIVLPHDVASLSEAVIAAADGLNQLEPSPSVRNLYNWLIASHSHWSHVRLGREIELRRMSNTAYDSYSGRLAAPRLIAIVAEELGENHIWSASQFNDYGMCGFRFFAKRLLRLEAVEEPDDGLDAAQLGTLNHAILEETYGRISALGATITPEFADQALTILREVAAELLKSAPERLNFRASALWEQEKVTLLRKLEAVIKLDFSDQSPVVKKFGDEPRRPYRLEAPFGDDARPVSIPIDDVVGSLKVQGYIDRIDRQGVKVILIDYKTGSTTIKTEEMERGRNFQMMLYLLAAQRILSSDPDADAPQAVAGGLFWHLRNQKTSGDITLDDRGLASIIQAQQHLSRHIQRGRAGDFAVQPNKLDHGKCSHYCEFNQLCRVSTINRLKE